MNFKTIYDDACGRNKPQEDKLNTPDQIEAEIKAKQAEAAMAKQIKFNWIDQQGTKDLVENLVKLKKDCVDQAIWLACNEPDNTSKINNQLVRADNIDKIIKEYVNS